MTGKTLIVVSVAWLVAVLLWLFVGRGVLALTLFQQRPVSRALVWLLVFFYYFLLLGWTWPLAVGVFRLNKNR